MPTLFDSHEEFNEWFSRDIESHAENKSGIDESEYPFKLLDLPVYITCRIRFHMLIFILFRFRPAVSIAHDPEAVHVETYQEGCRE